MFTMFYLAYCDLCSGGVSHDSPVFTGRSRQRTGDDLTGLELHNCDLTAKPRRDTGSYPVGYQTKHTPPDLAIESTHRSRPA